MLLQAEHTVQLKIEEDGSFNGGMQHGVK